MDRDELDTGQERLVADDLASGAANVMDGVLSRVWLTAPGDICPDCPMLRECPDRTLCLHLATSAGVTRRTDGPFRRFPIGARQVGHVARTLESFVARDGPAISGLADPGWLATHRVRGFAAIALGHGGRCLGVLALFSRRPLDAREVACLELAARAAGFALAQSRALSESARARARLAAELDAARRPAVTSPAGAGWMRPLRDLERDAIERVLAHTGGRVSGPRGAAAILGMKPTTLDSRIRKLGARKPRPARRPGDRPGLADS